MFSIDTFYIYSNSFDHLSNPVDFDYCQIDDKNGADPNHRGWTALTYAVHYGHYNIVKVLLEKRASSNHCDLDNMTSLMCSAQNGHTRCIEMPTHYSHGNNKIIAKFVRIPNQSHHQYNSSNESNGKYSSDDRSYSFDTLSQANKPKSPIVLNTRGSFTSDDQLNHLDYICIGINQPFEVRLGFGEMTAHQDLNEIRNSNQPSPRPIFKQRPRPLSSSIADLNNKTCVNQNFMANQLLLSSAGPPNFGQRSRSLSNSNIHRSPPSPLT